MRLAVCAVVVVGATCTPDAPSGEPLQPVLGHVWDERTVVGNGEEQTFRLGAYIGPECQPWCEYLKKSSFVITIPAAALPRGGRLVVRLVSAVERPAPPPRNALQTVSGSPDAIHLLPAELAFAQPLRVAIRTDFFRPPMVPRSEVFHAREGDAGWALVGPAMIDVNAAESSSEFITATLSATMTEPGLWTLSRWFE